MRAPTDVSRRVHRTYVRIRARGLRGVVEKCRASGSSVAGTVLMLLHLKRFVQSIPRRIRDYVTRVTRASLEDRSSVSRFLGFPGNASKLDLRAETGAVGGGGRAGGRRSRLARDVCYRNAKRGMEIPLFIGTEAQSAESVPRERLCNVVEVGAPNNFRKKCSLIRF
jgi:hypothetical protein